MGLSTVSHVLAQNMSAMPVLSHLYHLYPVLDKVVSRSALSDAKMTVQYYTACLLLRKKRQSQLNCIFMALSPQQRFVNPHGSDLDTTIHRIGCLECGTGKFSSLSAGKMSNCILGEDAGVETPTIWLHLPGLAALASIHSRILPRAYCIRTTCVAQGHLHGETGKTHAERCCMH